MTVCSDFLNKPLRWCQSVPDDSHTSQSRFSFVKVVSGHVPLPGVFLLQVLVVVDVVQPHEYVVLHFSHIIMVA